MDIAFHCVQCVIEYLTYFWSYFSCRNNSFGRVAWENEYDVGRSETCKNITEEAILCTLWVYD